MLMTETVNIDRQPRSAKSASVSASALAQHLALSHGRTICNGR